MNQNEKTPTEGKSVRASNVSGADKSEYTTTDVICMAETAKGVLLKSKKSGDELWLPKKQIEIITGEYGRGAELTVTVKKEIIQRARQNRTGKAEISFTTEVLVKGCCTGNRPKAIGVLCEADQEQRWFAKSKIVRLETDAIPNQPVQVIVPAWVLKRQNGNFPAWVKEAIV